jgi:N-acetylglutamate synthase-like GNAT family acetyltransferase
VDPAHRGQGITQKLVGPFAESAEDHGIKNHHSGDQQPDQDAAFFSRLGFVYGKMLHYQKELSV